MKRNNDTVYKLITQDSYISLENYVISPKHILKSQILKLKLVIIKVEIDYDSLICSNHN